jgi:hypothetical protein
MRPCTPPRTEPRPSRPNCIGLVIAGTGALVIVAVSRSEPNTATGLDGALKTLGARPYGEALLIAAGLGIITYGLYSFAMARYTKM